AAPGGWGAPGGPVPPNAPGWSPQQPPAGPPPGWGAPGGPPPQQTPMHGWGAPGGPGWGAPPQGGPGWGPPRGWQGPYLPAAKPGIIPLRPLGVGELLDGAVAAMRRHWKVMIGLSLVIAVITQAITVPLQWAMLNGVDTSVLEEDDPDPDELLDVLGPVVGFTAIDGVVLMLGQLIITGLLTLVVSRAVLGKSLTLGQAWSGARPLLLRLLGVSLMTFLIVLGLIFACMLPGLLILTVSDAGAALMVLGALGGMVLAFYAFILLQLAAPALILEKQTVRKALLRSRKLVTGSWWRVCGITLLIMLLVLLIGGVIQAPFAAVTGLSEFGDMVPDSFTDSVILGVGSVLAAAVTYPLAAGATALLYIDQRMRREALDLELGRAAGLVPDDATPAAP
ncbi:hypothetical protein, partial [Yinghuangia soli]